MEKYCKKCGMKIEHETQFCLNCGARINSESDTKIRDLQENAPSTEQDIEEAREKPAAPKMPIGRRIGITFAVTLPLALVLFLVYGYFFIHMYNPATCTETEICKICGKSGANALGHDWDNWEEATAATCLENGEEERVCKRDNTHTETRKSSALGHDWLAADCETPETCSVCGETKGKSLGHDWEEWEITKAATCEEAGSKKRICRRDSSHIHRNTIKALGHDWIPATYDAPETCARCGETRGEVKGYIGYLSGDFSDESISLSDNTMSPFILKEEVHNCISLTMDFTLTKVGGNPYGTWNLFARDLSGNWFWVGSFQVEGGMLNQSRYIPFKFSTPISFNALCLTVEALEWDSVSYNLGFPVAQVKID